MTAVAEQSTTPSAIEAPPVPRVGALDLLAGMLTPAMMALLLRPLRRDWADFARRTAGMTNAERQAAGRERMDIYLTAFANAIADGADDAAAMMGTGGRR